VRALPVAERFLRSTLRAATLSDLAPQLVAEAAVPGGAPCQTPVGAVGDKCEAVEEDARMRAAGAMEENISNTHLWVLPYIEPTSN
jgi:hypothetical protein